MAKLVEMDYNIKFSSQLEEDVGPIVFVNKFTVNPEDFDEFLKAWEADATYFKSQPGLISSQLHKGIGASGSSLTMQFGNQLHNLRTLLTTLTFRLDSQIILLAQSYLHISSRKSQFEESVWSNSISVILDWL